MLKASSNGDYSDELGEVCEFLAATSTGLNLKPNFKCWVAWRSTAPPLHHVHYNSVTFTGTLRSCQARKLCLFQKCPKSKVCSFDAGHERCVRTECICNAKDKQLFMINNDSNTLNNVMVLHIHKHLTDTIDHDRTSILNEFASCSDDRHKQFSVFIKKLINLFPYK